MGKIYVIDMIQCENYDKEAVKGFWKKVSICLSKKRGFFIRNLQESVNPQSHYQLTSICEWEGHDQYLSAFQGADLKLLLSEKPSSANFDSTVCESYIVHRKAQKLTGDYAILVNPFEINNEDREACLQMWQEAARFLASQNGFISTNLCRSVDQNSRFKLINIAEWETPQHFITAVTSPDFLSISRLMDFKHYPTISRQIDSIKALAREKKETSQSGKGEQVHFACVAVENIRQSEQGMYSPQNMQQLNNQEHPRSAQMDDVSRDEKKNLYP